MARHFSLRLRPVVSAEEVVEAFFRCGLTNYLTGRFNLAAEALPACINSSHRAVRRVCCSPRHHQHLAPTESSWETGWRNMQAQYPDVNIRDGGRRSARRADLYLVAAQRLVSLEFKYVGGAGLRGMSACLAQMQRHAEHHDNALFVVYCGGDADYDVEKVKAGLSDNATLVVARGPRIKIARAT